MDEKDIRILKAIAAEGINSPDKLQEATGIPKSTIHYRLNQLREEGILENDIMDMNLEKIGLSITLISEVWAEFKEGYHDRVGEKLADIEGVNQVYFTMGDTDFVVISHVTSRQMVESLVEDYEAIDEIRRTSSKFVITTVKDEPRPINDFEFETLEEALTDD
ncbi:Lrp/AsnC family transcriptional regulator [Natribaculum luteum]|uniref:Lrp/AsnC family transcriptional regulator n=1 Tax=Natribaculum luteum TaxID=1586232 RepID=A0ABD5NXM7_9EURY|nr:Lrp/AsnC family transcriptional regulator [Natribaculum luteum]